MWCGGGKKIEIKTRGGSKNLTSYLLPTKGCRIWAALLVNIFDDGRRWQE
jgi:hypothetical protein